MFQGQKTVPVWHGGGLEGQIRTAQPAALQRSSCTGLGSWAQSGMVGLPVLELDSPCPPTDGAGPRTSEAIDWLLASLCMRCPPYRIPAA